MKAAVINQFGSPEVFEINDVEKPSIESNQMLIKVSASSINPIDWKQRKGNHKFILGSPFPITLGYDVSGEVIEIGSEVNNFKPGDKVFGVLDNKYGGALAEYAKGSETCFAKIPEELDLKEAAAYPMVCTTALQALRDKANLKPGHKILINGASGGVGHVAIQTAKIMQTEVIAVASSKSESFVKSLNPDKFIDYTKQDLYKINDKVDVILDVIGNLAFPKVKHLLNRGGVYLNLNYIDSMKKMPIYKIHQIFSKGKRAKTILMKSNRKDLELVAKWVSKGILKVYIDEEFNLKNISAEHDYAQQGHNKGKNIVVISN